jgi:hypothetical protein
VGASPIYGLKERRTHAHLLFIFNVRCEERDTRQTHLLSMLWRVFELISLHSVLIQIPLGIHELKSYYLS